MPKPDWTWLIIGMLLGWWVLPQVVSRVRTMA